MINTALLDRMATADLYLAREICQRFADTARAVGAAGYSQFDRYFDPRDESDEALTAWESAKTQYQQMQAEAVRFEKFGAALSATLGGRLRAEANALQEETRDGLPAAFFASDDEEDKAEGASMFDDFPPCGEVTR